MTNALIGQVHDAFHIILCNTAQVSVFAKGPWLIFLKSGDLVSFKSILIALSNGSVSKRMVVYMKWLWAFGYIAT
jgi:hypothetical protein